MSRKKKILFVILALIGALLIINHRWVGYLVHLAKHQFRVVFYKEKISERLKRTDLKAQERGALEATLRIRKFAEGQYGLSSSKSYQSFFALGRKELGYNITVAPALSLKPESFHFFPIGSFDYLGFFDKEFADRWANEYRKRGFDVHLAEIGGYSTLGWFEDPLYSSQLDWGETGLARLLGHEIAHEKLYFSSDTTFSELLAAFIEKKISRDYLIAEKKPVDSEEKISERKRRRLEFIEMVMQLRNELEKLYGSSASETDKLQGKKSLIEKFGKLLMSRRDYFEIKKLPEINNASLAQFHRYTPQGKAFENLFDSCQKAEPNAVYLCWFKNLEFLKPCSNAARKNWLAGDGKISAARCQ